MRTAGQGPVSADSSPKMPLVRHLTGKPTFGLLIFRINGQLYSGERTPILDVLLGDQR
jgi:hypothetical protein